MGAFDLTTSDLTRLLDDLQYAAQLEEKAEDLSNALDLKAQAAGVPMQVQPKSAASNSNSELEITYLTSDSDFVREALDEVLGKEMQND